MINGLYIFTYSKPIQQHKEVHTIDTRFLSLKYNGPISCIRSVLGKIKKEKGLVKEYNGDGGYLFIRLHRIRIQC